LREKMSFDTDIAWLAGIIDGEGCFSVKRQVKRLSGNRVVMRACYQVWIVVCNTSEPMIRRIEKVLDAIGVKHQPVRRVWKGKKATRWQYWIHVARKHEVLLLTEALLPHLTAKKDEAEVVAWYMRRACAEKQHSTSLFERTALEAMSLIKRNGGEAPAEVRELLREVIPSQAAVGHHESGEAAEGVETRVVSPNDNPPHECPAPLHLVGAMR